MYKALSTYTLPPSVFGLYFMTRRKASMRITLCSGSSSLTSDACYKDESILNYKTSISNSTTIL